MTIENQLKNLICDKYGSMRNFARTIEISQSTLATILSRGVQNASITTIIKICDALEISVDALAENKIVPKRLLKSKEYSEYEYILEYMTIDGELLSDYEKWNLKKAFNYWVQNIRDYRKLFNGFDYVLPTAKMRKDLEKYLETEEKENK